jgi:hypothetical protein
VLCVLAAALHLGLVVRLRELLLLASHVRRRAVESEVQLQELLVKEGDSIRFIHLRPIMRGLEHDRTVAELLNEAVLALDGCESSEASS